MTHKQLPRHLMDRLQREIHQHPVIVNNPYTKWFKMGNANTEQVKDLVLQFSVFSNYFLVIQCKRMVNAPSEAVMKLARDIMVNELGVKMNTTEDNFGDTDGNKFQHKNAHLNWLRKIGEMLDLDPDTLGNWSIGTEATHKFLEQLEEAYGSRDNNIGGGASFAIETWAGHGIGHGEENEYNNFWKELVIGLEVYNKKHREPEGKAPIGMGFFQHHFDIEAGHVKTVEKELEEEFFSPGFDEEKWFEGARRALQAIYIFWLGLNETRKKLESKA